MNQYNDSIWVPLIIGSPTLDENVPSIESSNGTKEWYIHGVLHRKNEPAIICLNGNTEWWFNGRLHRIDGSTEWWFNGIEYTKVQYQEIMHYYHLYCSIIQELKM